MLLLLQQLVKCLKFGLCDLPGVFGVLNEDRVINKRGKKQTNAPSHNDIFLFNLQPC